MGNSNRNNNIKRTKRSPMHTVLSNVDEGIHSANGILSRMWRMTLSKLRIQAHQWDRLVEIWSRTIAKLEGISAPNYKKNNTVSRLAGDSMSWYIFFQGLQILNASNRFSNIRFELHLTTKKGNVEVIGLDILDKSDQAITISEEVVSVPNSAVINLFPDQDVCSGAYYRLNRFNNARYNNKILQFVGVEAINIPADYWNNWSTIGQLILDGNGVPSNKWLLVYLREI